MTHETRLETRRDKMKLGSSCCESPIEFARNELCRRSRRWPIARVVARNSRTAVTGRSRTCAPRIGTSSGDGTSRDSPPVGSTDTSRPERRSRRARRDRGSHCYKRICNSAGFGGSRSIRLYIGRQAEVEGARYRLW
ncbi:hypothetical protein FOQG_16615 [Fusarium oxysporum f. sp. raphani 54005]|uniref:Uncharacterized protein n=1 Tax=Fusarium oxysporum f. sp. raphani 54005 TaxID=1089458 RepID=X0B9C1_FUSOX|nr:hypothetical protein FOQG_16615 [Fusarium oxysporum f. sp. raphani 54005]